MTAWREFPLEVRFGAAKTDENDRHVQVGTLVENINTREDKKGELLRRYAFDNTAISSYSVSPVGPWTEVLPNGVMIDGAFNAFVYDTDALAAYDRGYIKRVHSTWQRLGNKIFGTSGTQVALSPNGDVWLFSIGCSTAVAGTPFPAQMDQVQYTVLDPNTGTIKHPVTTVNISANSMPSFAVVSDQNGIMFLFTVADNGAGTATITSRRWTSGYTVAPTAATYQTHAGNFRISDIDAIRLSNGTVMVGYVSQWAANSTKYGVSTLNTATGVASAAFNASDADATTTSLPLGFSFVENSYDGTNISWVYRGRLVSGANEERIRMGTTVVAGLATGFVTIANCNESFGNNNVVAYRTGGNTVVYTMQREAAPGSPNGRQISIVRHTWNGASTTTATVATAAWIASRPILVGSTWYFVTGFDEEDATNGINDKFPLQNGYIVRDSDGTIVGQALYSEGPLMFQNSSAPDGASPCCAPSRPFLVSSTKIGYGGIADGRLTFPFTGSAARLVAGGEPVLVTLDTAATYHCGATVDGRAIVPGGIVQVVGAGERVFDVSPIHSPYQKIPALSPVPSGGTVSTNYVSYRYVFFDGAGNEYQSAPSAFQSFTFKDNGVGAQEWTMRLYSPDHVKNGTIYIKLYGGTNPGGTTMFHQLTVPAGAPGTYVNVAVSPQNWQASGEALEDQGDGGLINDPPPSCRLTGIWRKRVVLGGTSNGRYRVSKELEAGKGPEFNATLAFNWPDVPGDDGAMCELSWDVYALFRAKGIGVVTGQGPDGNGNGAYVVQTITREFGCTNPRSVATGDGGCFFQNVDGRILKVTPGGVDESVGVGMFAYRGRVVSAAIHDSTRNLVRFYCTSGECLVFDYGKKTAEHPAGQWRMWSGSDVGVAIGAFLDANGVPVHVVSQGSLVDQRRLGVGWSGIARRLTIARIPANGKLGEFVLDGVTFSMTLVSGSGSWTITLDHEGTTEARTATTPAGDFYVQANVHKRVREVRVTMQEAAGAGEGHMVDGFTMLLKLTQAIKKLNTNAKIA